MFIGSCKRLEARYVLLSTFFDNLMPECTNLKNINPIVKM